MSAFCFQILPLGGLGKIGGNSTLILTPRASVLIDGGLLLGSDQNFGVDCKTPNFDSALAYLRREGRDLDALILTHTHEDHVGALIPFFDAFPRAKLFCSQFAKSYLKQKGIQAHPSRIFCSCEELPFADFTLTPVEVPHSTPSTFALFFRSQSEKTGLFFASDFKLQTQNLLDEKVLLDKMKDLRQSVTTLYSFLDSTNILKKGHCPSESSLLPQFETLFSRHKDVRLFATFFASNVERLKLFFHLAKEFRRRVFLLGRSLEFFSNLTSQLKELDTDQISPLRDFSRFQKSEILLLSTGCQGEFFGGLRRLLDLEVKGVTLSPKDVLLYSAKTIPGNELPVNALFNKAAKEEMKIYTEGIHTSGHAYRGDLQKVYESLSPDVAIPIHGETSFLLEHKGFVSSSFPHIKSEVCLNGQSLKVMKGNQYEIETLKDDFEMIAYDRFMNPLPKEILKERYKMAATGIVCCSLNPSNPDQLSFFFKGVPGVSQFETWLKKKVLRSYRPGQSTREVELMIRRAIRSRIQVDPLCEVQFYS